MDRGLGVRRAQIDPPVLVGRLWLSWPGRRSTLAVLPGSLDRRAGGGREALLRCWRRLRPPRGYDSRHASARDWNGHRRPRPTGRPRLPGRRPDLVARRLQRLPTHRVSYLLHGVEISVAAEDLTR